MKNVSNSTLSITLPTSSQHAMITNFCGAALEAYCFDILTPLHTKIQQWYGFIISVRAYNPESSNEDSLS